MNNLTITSIFESNKDELGEKLKGLTLPKDSKKIQVDVAEFLNNLFENNGAYRQSLTQSEEYILQASLYLLQAQQNIATEIAVYASKQHNAKTNVESSTTPYISLVGTGVGGIIGGLLGTWGTICGAIAGTAIAVYCSTKATKKTDVTTTEFSINTKVFTDIVKKICESIDGLMQTYRVQVKRIENAYNQKEQPTLQGSYGALLDQVANVYNVVKSVGDAAPVKVHSAVEFMVESLENYDLAIKNGKIVNK
ncbi:hypothetical protein [Bacteroides sp. 519]|uniref:hypothetical protein n=1 Tax=Bacteroides sp. 519 TaxID=2302937 RepID=UPI0013D1170C|nr:hypothetical protein [Bacteroides sp. 519]NDV59082.1 hypothetical protein [Bacteroides sp. 519]